MVVWLIHGTWGRRSRWTHDGSPIRSTLQQAQAEPVAFEQFQWTGRNRSMDRGVATHELIEAVESAAKPRERRIAIAHSHGGNVAVMAAGMKPGLFDAVITLNTPFLAPMPRNRSAVLLHGLLLIASLSFVGFHWLPVGYRAIAIGSGVFGILGLLGAVWWLRKDFESEIPPIRYSDFLSQWYRRRDEKRLQRGPRVLCLISADDEAFGWLEAIDVLSNLPRLMLSKTAVLCTLVAIALLHGLLRWNFSPAALEFFFTLVFRVTSTEDSVKLAESIAGIPTENVRVISDRIYGMGLEYLWMFFAISVVAYFMTIWTVLALGALVATFLVRAVAFGEGIGPLALVRAFAMRLKATPTPLFPAQTEVVVFTSTTTRGLRHSDICSNPNAIDEIVRWLEKGNPKRSDRDSEPKQSVAGLEEPNQ